MTLYRVVCERCGRVTVTPLLPDTQARVYREPDGRDGYVQLCPECKGQWERMLSAFLTSEIMSLHDLETGACKCEQKDSVDKEGRCTYCKHGQHVSRRYCGALA